MAGRNQTPLTSYPGLIVNYGSFVNAQHKSNSWDAFQSQTEFHDTFDIDQLFIKSIKFVSTAGGGRFIRTTNIKRNEIDCLLMKY